MFNFFLSPVNEKEKLKGKAMTAPRCSVMENIHCRYVGAIARGRHFKGMVKILSPVGRGGGEGREGSLELQLGAQRYKRIKEWVTKMSALSRKDPLREGQLSHQAGKFRVGGWGGGFGGWYASHTL